MKKLTFLYLLFLLVAPLRADRIGCDDIRIVRRDIALSGGDHVVFNLSLALEREFDLGSNHRLVLTPLLQDTDSAFAPVTDTCRMKEFAPVLLYGRRRDIIDRREGADHAGAYRVLRRDSGTEQLIDYTGVAAYEPWMDEGKLILWLALYGCADCEVEDAYIPLARLVPPFDPTRFIDFLTPVAPDVKRFELSGSAYLDFPVNRTELYPDYRRNPQELDKIRASIDSVRNERNAGITTITSITIHGYASPEGSYANNTRLAEGRAQTLRDYVVRRYALADVPFTVRSTPEDWAGLRRAVETGSYPQREEALAIIGDTLLHPDRRNDRLARLEVYRTLLNDVYPALRHSDYTIHYTVRDFTTEEAVGIYRTRPWMLSQNEMYRVAQTMQPGTPEYNKLFLTAVTMFPADSTANLNAASVALQMRDLGQAAQYLERAGNSPQAQCNRAVLLYLQGKQAEAISLFRQAAEGGSVQAAAAVADFERREARRRE